MWEADYCAGITLWGYIYGRTWTTDGNSGIIKDGKDRPAMTWLREYMKTDAAKNAKSPFPGMVKEASVYVKPQALSVTKNEPVEITVRARLKTKTIEKVDLYVKNKLYCTMTEAPYTTTYTPEALGKYDLKAIVTATDGSTYERLSAFTAYNPRAVFGEGTTLPGTLQAENFDSGADGISYHDSNSNNEGGTSYRSNGGGVDIVTGNGGYAIGYTVTGEWLEYTVNVEEAGTYSFDASVSSGVTTSSFSLSLSTDNGLTQLTDIMPVPCVKANNWDTYKTVHGRLLIPLEAGKQIIRLNITGGNCNVDKITFKRVEIDNGIRIALKADPSPATINTNTTLKATATSNSGTAISNIKFYVDNVLVKMATAEPFEVTYRPTAVGTLNVTAIATDADGKQSNIATYALKVNNKRMPYKGVIDLPGIVQAENFDRGGADFTFHDADDEDEGDANYRTDNGGVDIVTGNGGYALGYTAVNDWTEYTINVTDPGRYTCEATVSSGVTGSSFSIGLVQDGKVITLGKISVPQTGNSNWDTYTTAKCTFARMLEAGEHIIRITIAGANCNIDKLNFKCIMSTDIDEIEATQPQNEVIYNLAGQKVDSSYKGIVIKNGRKYLNR